MPERPVLFYDADCRFCRFVARMLVRLDRRGRLAFLPLQAPEAPALLPGLGEVELMGSIHLLERDRRSSGGDALVRLLRLLGLSAPRALGRLYAPVADRRGALGPLVPKGPAPRRYP